ncbi:hypothetical protein VitviT2T_007532 [Vitis vinifera]|uniref:Uncharacterized protein n=1 Tax=Vitis vinifera TaxID=29760 RepID=A0ABY9C0A9_VITVI|nr:hypothetical protein VitviT2T_007532 [Vitis vinifera]
MGLVLGENARFQSRAQTVVDIIIETANGASGTIHNITGAMRNIRHDSEAADVGKFITFRFTGDSCTALEDFEQNPYNSSLSAIIPCHELLSAKPVFSDVSSGIYNLVDEVNACIGNSFVCETLTDSVFLSGLGKLQVNREAFLRSCLVSAILSQPHRSTNSNPKAALLVQFRCQRFLRYLLALMSVEIYTTSIQSLLNVYPGMENLVECQMVKDAFSEIIIEHCKPLKR